MAGTASDMVGGGKQVSASKEELKPKRKKLRSQTWTKAANGGLSAEHNFESSPMGPYEPSETHTFGKHEGHKAVEHFAKHMRIKGAWTPAEGVTGGDAESEPAERKGKAMPDEDEDDDED